MGLIGDDGFFVENKKCTHCEGVGSVEICQMDHVDCVTVLCENCRGTGQVKVYHKKRMAAAAIGMVVALIVLLVLI